MTVAVSPRTVSTSGLPALVLNADYRPLSYYPLSLWSWQDAIKAVFLERVNIVAEYDHIVSSPSFSMRVPSVICLKDYVKPPRYPAFTRFNVFLRDRFECQYCGSPHDLTFDHVTPRCHGGDDDVGKCGRRLFTMQSAQGRHDARRRAYVAAPEAGHADRAGSAQ